MSPVPEPAGARRASTDATVVCGLDSLNRQVLRDLALLGLPAHPWTRLSPLDHAPDVAILDVIVIGAGMAGLAATAALGFHGIASVRCLDRAPQGREGPWITSARMETLRTPKGAVGPALGVPSLTFRAWFEAQHGSDAWDALDRIPREQWMDYLVWYRQVLALPVQNDAAVTRIEPRDDAALVDVYLAGVEAPLVARRVVLATGLDGMGAPSMPAWLEDVERHRYAHSSQIIGAAAVKDARIAVIGAGASAMDNAAFALEAGAAHVHLLVRRRRLPAVDTFGALGHAGLTLGYTGLPDKAKQVFVRLAQDTPVPAPRHSIERVVTHRNVTLHLASPVLSARGGSDGVRLTTPRGDLDVDYLILATGFRCDPFLRPELGVIAAHILMWRDIDASSRDDAKAGSAPYLAADFSLQARDPLWRERLSRIHCLTFDAVPSAGRLTSGVPAISEAAQRLVRGIARAFLREDAQHHLTAFQAYDRAEFPDTLWPAEQVAS